MRCSLQSTGVSRETTLVLEACTRYYEYCPGEMPEELSALFGF